MKSASGSKACPNRWRLSRTLKRAIDFRPIEDADLKYLWAAYRKGALAAMGQDFAAGDLPADQFKALLERTVVERYDAAWTLFAKPPGKSAIIPVGVVFAAWERNAPYMVVGGVVWFPWASDRNVIEALVGFLTRVRKDVHLMLYALPEHKRAYEVCAMHGVMRRVGTSYVAIPGHAAAQFETRAA